MMLVYAQCPPLSIALPLLCVAHLYGPRYEEKPIVHVTLVGTPA